MKIVKGFSSCHAGYGRSAGALKAVLLATAVVCVPAAGAADDNDGFVFEEIIVTGEKVARSIMDTASSVQVFNSEELKKRTADQLEGVLATIPNMTVASGHDVAPSVRGVDGNGSARGAEAFIAGSRPRLNYVVDGRTLSFTEVVFSDTSIHDVDAIEVFRGPQSTLQGRNSIAGVIIVNTKKPTEEFEFGGSAAIGERETRQFSGYVSGPIVEDQVMIRLSGDYKHKNSYVTFAPFSGPLGDITDPEEHESFAGRAKILIKPKGLEGFEALLAVSHIDGHKPTSNIARRPLEDNVARVAEIPVWNIKSTTGTASFSYAPDETVSYELFSAYSDYESRRFATLGGGSVIARGKELTIEPRVQVSTDGFSGVFGGYFFDSDRDEYLQAIGPNEGTFIDTTKTHAVYGEGTFSLTDTLRATIGARYEEEKRDRDGSIAFFSVDFHETYKEFLPRVSLAYDVNEDVTIGASVSRGYNGGGAGVGFFPPFPAYRYDAEYVWSYETFLRASLDRLMVTANIFYNKYTDMQLPFDVNTDPLVTSSIVANVDSVSTYGAELSLRYAVSEDLEVYGNFGVLKTKVSNPGDVQIDGNDLLMAPATSADVGVFYGKDQGIQFFANARYSDAYYSDSFNLARGKTDAYIVTNARLGYQFEKFKIYVSGTNLLDSRKAVFIEPGATFAADTGVTLEPRTFLAGIQFDF